MEGELRQWVYMIVFIVVLMSFLQHLIAGKKYEKYIRFYIGLILIIVVISPLSSIFGGSENFQLSFVEENFRQAVGEAAEKAEYLHEIQETQVSQQYEEQLRSVLKQRLNEEGYELLSGKIILGDEREGEQYLYPVQIHAQVRLIHTEGEMYENKDVERSTESDQKNFFDEQPSEIAVDIEEVIPIDDVTIEGTLLQSFSSIGNEEDTEIRQLEEKIAEFFQLNKEVVQIEMEE